MGLQLFESMPSPDRDVVDRVSRDRAALLLRRFAAGQITNDDFDNAIPITADPAIGAIWNTAWLFYSDSTTHALTGRDRLHPDMKRAWVRWILFLDSDIPYEWPQISYPGNDPYALGEARLDSWFRSIFVREDKKNCHREFEQAGHYPVWPFISQKDYRKALRNPRRLRARN